jgi:PIN domain nuclease of toxin-antitoxin system
MIYLLDTHAFIWATLATARLSRKVKKLFQIEIMKYL